MKFFSHVLLLVVAAIQPNSGHSKDHSKHHHKKHQQINEDINLKISSLRETVNQDVRSDPSPINHLNLNPPQTNAIVPPPKDSVSHVPHRFYLNKPLVDTLKVPQTNPSNPAQKNLAQSPPQDKPSQQPHHFQLNQPKKEAAPQITCVDESNQPVDWIIFYKLPRVHGSPNAHIVNGEAYMYVSSEDVRRFEESNKKTNPKKDAEHSRESKKQKSPERDSMKSKSEFFQKNSSEKTVEKKEMNSNGKSKKYKEMKNGLSNNVNKYELWKETESKKSDNQDKQTWTYYPYSFFNTNDDTTNDLQKDELDPKHEYTYYAYDSNNNDAKQYINNGGDKSFLDNLKDALVKLFAKDARDQISVERGDINEMNMQDKAKLLKSELAVGQGKRRSERDTHQKNANLLNNLLKTHILKDGKDTSKVKNMLDHIDKTVTPNELSEIMQAFELLNGDEKLERYVDNDGLDGEMRLDGEINTRNDVSQSGKIATEVSDNQEELDRTRFETVSSSEEYEGDDANNEAYVRATISQLNNISKVSTKADLSSIEEETPPSETRSSTKDKLQWTLSTYSVRDPQSLPGRILSPFLFNASFAPAFSVDGLKILYNDQTPNSTTVKFGHSKGLVLGNSNGGVWIVHSVPHFVDDAQASYTYPHTGLMYGQNFLCLSLNATALDSVGHNLGHNQVFKYSTHISDNNRALYPTLTRIVDDTYATSGENYFTGRVHTRFHDVAFRTFAKTRELGEDLYARVGRDLGESLLVETWPNGPGRLRTDCQRSGRLVENVEAINATGIVAFRSTHDHAKWTISFGSGSDKTKSNFVEKKTDIHGLDKTKSNFVEKKTDIHGVDKTKSNFAEKKTETQQKRMVNKEFGIDKEAMLDEILRKGHSIDGSSEQDSASHESTDTVEENSYPYENIEEALSQARDSDENTSQSDKTENPDKAISELEDLENFTLNLKYLITNMQDSTENPQELSKNSEELSNNSEELSGASSVKNNGAGFFVCNGDINRAEDQLKRGGGTVCVDSEALWGLYHSLIEQVEPCPRG